MKFITIGLIAAAILAGCEPESTPMPAQTAAMAQATASPSPTPTAELTLTPEPMPTAAPDPRCSARDLTSSDRQEYYNLTLRASPGWASTRKTVKDFLLSRFYTLEAQYLALRALYPSEIGTWRDYLTSSPTTFNGEGWRLLFADVLDLAKSTQTPDTCGPEEAAYELLKYHGVNILSQAVTTNIGPVLAHSAREGIANRLTQCQLANIDLECNQAELVFQEAPRWESILPPERD